MGTKEFFNYLDKHYKERLRIKVILKKGKVADILVQYESLINGKWMQIVRYDCAHGFFHRDIIYPNGEQEKQAIEFDDLNSALTYAEQDLKDHWGIYKSKYLKRLKK